MQASDLVELAALVSSETPVMLRAGEWLDGNGIDAYWTASKCRLDRWLRRLKNCSDAKRRGVSHDRAPDQPCWSTCTEILTSVILTRGWTAAAAASDQLSQLSELAPITQSILFGHQEARQRVLNLIAKGLDLKQRPASQLDQLRRVCERWTDLLLAPLVELCELDLFAHDSARVHDFAQDQCEERASPIAERAREMLNASLQSTFRDWPVSPNRNADLNAQIAASILASLNLDRFDATGVRLEGLTYCWLFNARVMIATIDAQRMVDELLNPRS